MSYLVFARKYRPQQFDEIIGQEHISELLKKALASGRIAQAYLFCGPRGIGKTSCARILAKSLNCEKGPTVTPCGTCGACKDITNATSFDVLEIDGASNRGIDEIRALRENVKFAPSYGRYKIYIVDEVHMLTTEAFNALLKTLEEPPEHVKFIFATTDPNKVPGTIISRCQRFDFKRIALSTIVDALKRIAKEEKFKISDDALFAVAKAAKGSLRDALSILDQISALSKEGVGAQDVYTMLGLVETELIFQLAQAIGQKDCAQALDVLHAILNQGKDVKQLAKDLTEHFRHLMVIKVGGKSLGKLVDYPIALKEQILNQCGLFELSDILKGIDVLIGAQETARITESNRLPLELALAKLTYQEGARDKKPPVTPEPSRVISKEFSPMKVLKSNKGEADVVRPVADDQPENTEEAVADEPPLVEDNGSAIDVTLDYLKKNWDTLTFAVSRFKMSLATYLQEGQPAQIKDNTITIAFPKQCAFQKENLSDKQNLKTVEKIFSEKLGTQVFIHYTLMDEINPKEEESSVKSVIDTFQGKVVSRWHEES